MGMIDFFFLLARMVGVWLRRRRGKAGIVVGDSRLSVSHLDIEIGH